MDSMYVVMESDIAKNVDGDARRGIKVREA